MTVLTDAERRCTFPDCSLPAPAFRADMERLRRINAELVQTLDGVRVIDVGKAVYIGVMALGGCASAEVRPEDQEMFVAWKKQRDAALRSATETKGEPT